MLIVSVENISPFLPVHEAFFIFVEVHGRYGTEIAKEYGKREDIFFNKKAIMRSTT